MYQSFSIFLIPLLLFLASCKSYEYQRTLPGNDGLVYVQGLEKRDFILVKFQRPVIWKCQLRGEELNCGQELKVTIDNDYWKENYFLKEEGK